MDTRLDSIDWNYREAVARRQRERAARERRARAAQLFLNRIVAVMQLVFSVVFLICYSAVYFVQNMDAIESPTDQAVFIIGFVIAEACGWIYTLLFPWYFANLE